MVITNTGDATATSVSLSNPTPLNTTDTAGSVRVTPIVVDDAVTNIVANTQRIVSDAGGLLVNDFDPDNVGGGTILHCMGIDHRRFTYKFQGLDQRLTGVEEQHVVKALLA